MARQLAAIKLASMWSNLRAQTSILVLSILGFLYGLVVVGLLIVATVFLAIGSEPPSTTGLVAIPAIYTLGWVLVPVILASQEQTLDPYKLPVYVSNSPKLALSLVVVSIVGVGGAYFILFQIGVIAGWTLSFGITGLWTSLLAAVLGTSCALVWGKALGTWLGKRRDTSSSGKERAGLYIGLAFVALVPLIYLLPLLFQHLDTNLLLLVADYIKWTPFGAPWAIPASVTSGAWGALLIQLAITAVTIALGWLLLVKVLEPAMVGVRHPVSPLAEEAIRQGRSLVDPQANTQHFRPNQGTEAPRYLPGVDRWKRLGLDNPTAAIAERTRIYWLRDSRLLFQLVTPLMVALVALVLDITGPENVGAGTWLLFVGSFALGSVAGVLLQYDSTAFWLHVSTGVRGFQDRLGRFLPTFLIVLAAIAIGVGLYGVATGQTLGWIVYFLIANILLYTCCTAAATIIGSQWVYPVQPPGTSPMSTRGTGQFGVTMVVGLAQAAVGVLLAAIPGVLMMLAWHLPVSWQIGAALLAVLWSAGVSLLGIWAGGKIVDRSQVELLSKIQSWPGHRVHV